MRKNDIAEIVAMAKKSKKEKGEKCKGDGGGSYSKRIKKALESGSAEDLEAVIADMVEDRLDD